VEEDAHRDVDNRRLKVLITDKDIEDRGGWLNFFSLGRGGFGFF
jgi:hypothetical protein